MTTPTHDAYSPRISLLPALPRPLKSTLLALTLLSTPLGHAQGPTPMPATTAPIHIANTFSFEIAAPTARLARLFAPEAERTWAGKDWNPEFIYPQPAEDIQGAVFKIQHGAHTAVWVTTRFDVQNGRMQYVYFIADKLVTTVDIALHSIDATHTAVNVTYSRTALDSAANEDVRAMGDNDRTSGPKWQSQIEAALHLNRK